MNTEERKPVIELADVSFFYGENEALSCVNLTVREGDYLGIIGPNGAGKTTLLKLILSLLKPTKGTIQIFGKAQIQFTERALFGYVPQKTALFDGNFPATVREVVLMGRYAQAGLFRILTKEDYAAIETALERVEMWGYRDRLIGDLSGGQQQRVFIARALASQPKILFLDEPTAGIDHKSQKDFYALLRKLHEEEGLTIILVSHDLRVVAAEASCIAYIDKTLSYYSDPQEFLDNSAQHALTHGHDH